MSLKGRTPEISWFAGLRTASPPPRSNGDRLWRLHELVLLLNTTTWITSCNFRMCYLRMCTSSHSLHLSLPDDTLWPLLVIVVLVVKRMKIFCFRVWQSGSVLRWFRCICRSYIATRPSQLLALGRSFRAQFLVPTSSSDRGCDRRIQPQRSPPKYL